MVSNKEVIFGIAFNFALEYAIWRVQKDLDGLILNGTHQNFVCADDFNILDGTEPTAGNKHGSFFNRY